MSTFSGNQIPAAIKRLSKHFSEKPKYFSEYKPGHPTFDVVEKAMDLIDDGINNNSTPVFKPITGLTAIINITNYDIGLGAITSGQITANINPLDTTETEKIIYTSSDLAIATVDVSGQVIALNEGNVDITVQIQGTEYTKIFNLTVLNTII